MRHHGSSGVSDYEPSDWPRAEVHPTPLSRSGAGAQQQEGEEDSSGKAKAVVLQGRHATLLSLFIVGLCLGVALGERLYLAINREDILSGVSVQGPGQGTPPIEATQLRDLHRYLQKVAPSKEVLVGVSNWRPLAEGMLLTFLTGIVRAKVKNYVIVSLDVQTHQELTTKGYNSFLMPLTISSSQKDTGDNHAISALKFGILKKFLKTGWSVLLSDIDVAVLQDPFKHLYRDSDVEGMTDGFDDRTAYGMIDGFDDPSMGWSRYAQLYKHFNLNSGLFFLRANPRTIDLMERLERRLSRQKYWDQTAYNEEIFFLSHDGYRSPQVTVRVMSIYKFMNSKLLFKDVRHRPRVLQPPMPVMVHINYHPDKHARMKAVMQFYLDGDLAALSPFPGGSEPGT